MDVVNENFFLPTDISLIELTALFGIFEIKSVNMNSNPTTALKILGYYLSFFFFFYK